MTGPDARSGGTTRRFALLALIAAELLMSFSFFGYFHVEPISVTTAYLPVLLAGALTGPPEAAAVGAVFGLASMWKASASYVMAADQLFSPFLSGDPLGSLVLSVGSRTLFGLATGLLYLAARHLRRPWIGVAAVSFFGRTIHSLMVYSAMGLFFPEAGYGPANALGGLLSPMDLLFNLTTAGVVLAFWRAAGSRLWQRFQSRVELSRTPRSGEEYHRLSLAVAIVVTLVSALAVTFYFMHRIDYVLEVNGIELTDTGYADVLHLQMQFLFGILSLMVLVVLFLILNRRYTSSYMALEGKLDSLTGVMTRKAFFAACSRALRSLRPQDSPPACFIMVDLDHFKEINDAYGHPEGDRALREAARGLREIFGRESIIGRMGGDEFAMLVCADLSDAELEVALRRFRERMHRVVWADRGLTCSIGALRVTAPRPPEELYLEADRLLYAAKERGRDQAVIGSMAEADPAAV